MLGKGLRIKRTLRKSINRLYFLKSNTINGTSPTALLSLRHVLTVPDFRAHGIIICMFITSRLWLVGGLRLWEYLGSLFKPIQQCDSSKSSRAIFLTTPETAWTLPKIVLCRSSGLKVFETAAKHYLPAARASRLFYFTLALLASLNCSPKYFTLPNNVINEGRQREKWNKLDILSLSYDHKWTSARLKPAHANNYSRGN